METKYKQFFKSDEAEKWAKQYKEFFPSDSDPDKEFLYALNIYTASVYVAFNNHLRREGSLLAPELCPSFRKLIEKIPTYHIPDNIVVYRYISRGLLKSMCPSYPPRKHMVIQDKAFLSTTLVRDSILPHRDSSQNILLQISVSSGTAGTYVGFLKDTLREYEVILAPNTKLQIDVKFFFNQHILCTVIN